jgi:large subunit ribosomal protein L29
MRAADLREKGAEDLRELQKSLAHDVFQNRLKNFTNRLDDTSTMQKTKRDLARVATLLRESELGIVRTPGEAKPPPKPKAPAKPKAAPVEAEAAPVAAAKGKKSATKKTDGPKKSKKSEAKQP